MITDSKVGYTNSLICEIIMNKSIFVLTVIGVIAAAMIASTVAIPNVSAIRCDNPRACGDDGDPADPRTINNLDTHIQKGGEHGNKAQEIKDSRNGCSGPSCGGDGGPSLP